MSFKIITTCILIVLLIGFVDYKTSWEISVFPLYGIPVLIIAWSTRLTYSLLIAAVATGVWWFANQNDNPYRTEIGYAWAAICRLSFYTCVAIAGSMLRKNQMNLAHKLQAVERISQMDRDLLKIAENKYYHLQSGLKCELRQLKEGLVNLKNQMLMTSSPKSGFVEQMDVFIESIQSIDQKLEFSQLESNKSVFHLQPALGEFLESIETNKSVVIDKEFLFESNQVPLDASIQIYRIVQEVLGVAIDYGKASKFSLTLLQDRKYLILTIFDNGPVKWAEIQKIWLIAQLLHHRASMLGAKLDLRNQSPCGTQLHLIIKI